MEQLNTDIWQDKYIHHLAWLDGIASLWEGWQMDLTGYSCQGFTFQNYNMKEMSCVGSSIDSSFFYSCVLDYAKINSTLIKNTDFSGCSMKNLSAWCTSIENVKMNYCNLDGSNFKFSDLRGVNLTYSSLAGCDFSYADIDDYTDIRLSNIIGANFTGTKFDYGKNPDVLPDFCYIKDISDKTYLLINGNKDIYPMPPEYAYLPPEKLNAALGINKETADKMYNMLITGWSGEMVHDSSVKAKIRIYNNDKFIYGFMTEQYDNPDNLSMYIDEVCDKWKKRNKDNTIDVDYLKKSKTTGRFEVFKSLTDYSGDSKN